MTVLRPLLGVASLALLFGCSSNDNPLLTDVAKQYGKSYCSKLEVCMGSDDFKLAYPGGQDDCALRTFRIHGTDERSLCTQEDWDECTGDLEKTTCVESDAGVSRPKIPDTCQGC
jgi:hypothetical protein